MTDYNKQTVANLRQLLKDRGIPSTGLTRKAQIVDKLEEWDNRGESAPAAAEPAPVAAQPDDAAGGQEQEEVKAAEPVTWAAPAPEATQETEAPPPTATAPASETTATEQHAEDVTMGTEASLQNPPKEITSADMVPEEQTAPEVSESAVEPAQSAQPEGGPTTIEAAMTDRTPSPSPDEKPSIEKPELLPIPERATPTTAEPSRLNSEELEADTRKRKRRSLTPDILSQDVRAKKPRPSQDAAPEVIIKDDVDTTMEQRQPEELEKEVDQKGMDQETNGISKSESKDKSPKEPTPAVNPEPVLSPRRNGTRSPTPPEAERHTAPERKEKAPRYRELFKPAVESTPAEAITDDRPIVPALHPATPGIYIRNFMRPLRPEALRAHLVSLASPPSASPDASIVRLLFLDAMKTHALVLLANTTAASRVRASLHGSIWPPEGNRKELWVDFVPEDKISDWIQEEEDAITADKEARTSGRLAAGKKFEVLYPEDENGIVTAIFQELGSSASSFNPPKGPRRPSQQVPPPISKPSAPTQETREDIEKSFKTLDELFLSTTSKPKLYYLPVSDDRSDDRLKDLDGETARDWDPEERRKGRGMQGSRLDQKVRFTFDDEDRVVEAGGDFGPWTEDYQGRRGGFRGGRGGGGRGRGGGWRSGPP